MKLNSQPKSSYLRVVRRIFWIFKHKGLLALFLATFAKVRYSVSMYYLLRIKKMDGDAIFSSIYKLNLWASTESLSGNGSTLEGTNSLRTQLPELLDSYNIRSIYDSPCGDFSWMSFIVINSDLKYIGVDIVPELINSLRAKYSARNVQFFCLDIRKSTPPSVDLVIIRDCLFHLSRSDVALVLKNFLDSEAKFLLTSSHALPGDTLVNGDIITGEFHLINIFAEPYNFPSDILAIIDDSAPDLPKKWLLLFSREQLLKVKQLFI